MEQQPGQDPEHDGPPARSRAMPTGPLPRAPQ